MFTILPLQDSHPRDNQAAERRAEIQLAQIENSGCGSPTKTVREKIKDDERGRLAGAVNLAVEISHAHNFTSIGSASCIY